LFLSPPLVLWPLKVGIFSNLSLNLSTPYLCGVHTPQRSVDAGLRIYFGPVTDSSKQIDQALSFSLRSNRTIDRALWGAYRRFDRTEKTRKLSRKHVPTTSTFLNRVAYSSNTWLMPCGLRAQWRFLINEWNSPTAANHVLLELPPGKSASIQLSYLTRFWRRRLREETGTSHSCRLQQTMSKWAEALRHCWLATIAPGAATFRCFFRNSLTNMAFTAS